MRPSALTLFSAVLPGFEIPDLGNCVRSGLCTRHVLQVGRCRTSRGTAGKPPSSILRYACRHRDLNLAHHCRPDVSSRVLLLQIGSIANQPLGYSSDVSAVNAESSSLECEMSHSKSNRVSYRNRVFLPRTCAAR